MLMLMPIDPPLSFSDPHTAPAQTVVLYPIPAPQELRHVVLHPILHPPPYGMWSSTLLYPTPPPKN